MLLTTFRKLCHPNASYKDLSVRLCSTVFQPQTNNPPLFVDNGIHNIRVTGQVTNIFNEKNDNVVFFVRSILPGNYRKIHKIVASLRSATILELAKKLKPQQHVSVEGKLNTTRFQTDDGKHRSTSAIMATELCIVSDVAAADDVYLDENQTQLLDTNSVELLGTITTDIVGADFKSFTLSTVKNPKYSRTDPKNLCSNRIFIYDKTLFSLLNDVKIKKDMFLVRGMISYRIATDRFGKVTTTSYIQAKQFYRA